MMVKSINHSKNSSSLDENDTEDHPQWIINQSNEFIKRLFGLLPSQLKNLSPELVYNIISSHSSLRIPKGNINTVVFC